MRQSCICNYHITSVSTPLFVEHLPIGTRCGVGTVVRLDLEVIENNGHLLVVLGQKQIGTVRVRRIVGGITRTVQFATLLRAAHVGEAACAVWCRRAGYLVLRLECVLALEATPLQLTRAEDHGQPWPIANHALRFVAAQLIVELVIRVRSLLSLQIDF